VDDVEAKEIRSWESSFLEYVKSAHPEIGEAIRTDKVIGEETDAALRKAIENHKRMFRTEAAPAAAAQG